MGGGGGAGGNLKLQMLFCTIEMIESEWYRGLAVSAESYHDESFSILGNEMHSINNVIYDCVS